MVLKASNSCCQWFTSWLKLAVWIGASSCWYLRLKKLTFYDLRGFPIYFFLVKHQSSKQHFFVFIGWIEMEVDTLSKSDISNASQALSWSLSFSLSDMIPFKCAKKNIYKQRAALNRSVPFKEQFPFRMVHPPCWLDSKPSGCRYQWPVYALQLQVHPPPQFSTKDLGNKLGFQWFFPSNKS